MFVVTQTHVQFVVPNVIKHKIVTEFSYNFACFNPPLCVSLACFSPCDDWTAFSIFFGHFSTNGLLCLIFQKLLSNVRLFDCSGCGTTSSSSSATVQWDWTVTALWSRTQELRGSWQHSSTLILWSKPRDVLITTTAISKPWSSRFSHLRGIQT